MKLDFSSIVEALEQSFEISKKNISNTHRTLSHAVFYRGQKQEDFGVIYICPLDCLSTSTEYSVESARVYIGMPSAEYLRPTSNYIVVSADASPYDVINCIQQLFTKFEAWCSALYKAFLEKQSIQAIIHLALPIFQNPVYAHDKNYRMFAYAENRENQLYDWNYDFYAKGQLSCETIKRLTNSPRFAQTFTTKCPTYYEREETIEDYNYLYINLWNDGKYAGRLFVDEKMRPISALDYPLLEELAHIIELSLVDPRHLTDFGVDYLQGCLIKLLSGEQLAEAEVENLYSELKWDLKKGFFRVQLKITEDDPYHNIALRLCDFLSAKPSSCTAFIYEGYILALFGNVADKQIVIPENLLRLATDYDLCGGISRIGYDLNELPLYLQQAKIAATYSNVEASHISIYDEHILDHMLSRCLDVIPMKSLIPSSLVDLMEYDKVGDTKLTETLRAYLESDLSPSKACDRLYIHRSTLLYRLERIKEIVHEDFHDPKVKLFFLLAFSLLDKQDSK